MWTQLCTSPRSHASSSQALTMSSLRMCVNVCIVLCCACMARVCETEGFWQGPVAWVPRLSVGGDSDSAGGGGEEDGSAVGMWQCSEFHRERAGKLSVPVDQLSLGGRAVQGFEA